MGKSKKRNFNKNTDALGSVIKRSDVVSSVLMAVRNNTVSIDIKNSVTLFGITIEELTEAGATLEEVKVFKKIML